MSYRPENQSLREPLDILIKGIEEGLPALDKAIDNREDSNEWQESHIEELDMISIQLRRIKSQLRKLRSENW